MTTLNKIITDVTAKMGGATIVALLALTTIASLVKAF